MRMTYRTVTQWPCLAWLAECCGETDEVVVYKGERVEVGDNFFCEAVWAGDFGRGDFDRTDVVMGSGGRLLGDRVTFVSSGSMIDRLQYLEGRGKTWISNSLACLASFTSAALDPAVDGYSAVLGSVAKGLKQYQPFIETSAGRVQLVYFNNLVWNRSTLSVIAKPGGSEDFSTFEKYHAFVAGCIAHIADNMRDARRRFPYRFMGTLSSGYDSATCAVLAKRCGLNEVVSFDVGRTGVCDSGADVARQLGFSVTEVDRSAWRKVPAAESLFLTADGSAADIMFAPLEAQLSSRVLLTGYNGDVLWGKDGVDLAGDLVRKDRSGLSLSEFRLKAGFINCTLAFLGARQISDINRISLSEEMKPWDVEGTYSRPIPRRIVEGAGVARAAFGMRKNAAVHQFASEKAFLSESSRRDYVQWLTGQQAAFRRAGIKRPSRLSPMIDRLYFELLHRVERGARSGSRVLASLPVLWRVAHSERLRRLRTVTYEGRLRGYRRFVYAWALERAKANYPKPQ